MISSSSSWSALRIAKVHSALCFFRCSFSAFSSRFFRCCLSLFLSFIFLLISFLFDFFSLVWNWSGSERFFASENSPSDGAAFPPSALPPSFLARSLFLLLQCLILLPPFVLPPPGSELIFSSQPQYPEPRPLLQPLPTRPTAEEQTKVCFSVSVCLSFFHPDSREAQSMMFSARHPCLPHLLICTST